jgi:G3E family GTPase
MDRRPVILLTGFLGAGKSTLLNDLLSDPAFSDTAVIINEFGDISIDHDLVRVGKNDRTTDLMRTTTGCLCCEAGSDIRTTLFELHEAARTGLAPAFSRVIVETTGLADPAPLVNQLIPGGATALGLRDHVVARAFELAGVIAAVDIVTGEMSIENQFEAAKQIAFADRIVLTKADLAKDPASIRDIAVLQQRLASINPTAGMIDRHEAGFDLAAFFAPRVYAPTGLGEDVIGWLALEEAIRAEPGIHGATPMSFDRHGGRIRTFVITREAPVPRTGYRHFVEALRNSAGPRLLRVKGLVAFDDEPDRPRVIHGVQHVVFTPRMLDAWPSEDKRSRLVFITDGIDEKPVRELFEAILDDRPSTLGKLLAVLSAPLAEARSTLAGRLRARRALTEHRLNAGRHVARK